MHTHTKKSHFSCYYQFSLVGVTYTLIYQTKGTNQPMLSISMSHLEENARKANETRWKQGSQLFMRVYDPIKWNKPSRETTN